MPQLGDPLRQLPKVAKGLGAAVQKFLTNAAAAVTRGPLLPFDVN